MLLKESYLPTGLTKEGFSEYGEPIDMPTVEMVREFIRTYYKPLKSINYDYGSYYIKHQIQRELGIYVSNGDAIAAFCLEGFKHVPFHMNAYFNVKVSIIKRYRNNRRGYI